MKINSLNGLPKLLLLASLFGASLSAAATTYYVSPSGSNGNPGTLAAPFATISKAAAAMVAGDTCYVRAGTYRETVVPANSGMALLPITFKAYPGESPVVDGADRITGWTSIGGGQYTASQPFDLGLGNNQLFGDGAPLIEARWPATFDYSFPGVAKIAAGTNTPSGSGALCTITDPNLTQPAGYWVGAAINIGVGSVNVFQSGTITSSSPGTLTFVTNQPLYENLRAGDPYFLYGRWGLIAGSGQSYKDRQSSLITAAFPPGFDPNAHIVEAKNRTYGFDLSGRSYINIDGINLFACNLKSSATTSNCNLTNFRARFLSHYTWIDNPWSDHQDFSGIVLNGTQNRLDTCALEFSAGDLVTMGGTGNVINNCLMHDADYTAMDNAIIVATGTLHQITNNTLYNSGRSIILHRASTTIKILHNEMYNAGLQTVDLGATYAGGTSGVGTEIAYNNIHDIWCGFGGTGIMLDNSASNYIVHHNLIWNVQRSLTLNTPSLNNTVVANTCVGGDNSLTANGSDPNMTGTYILNNIFSAPLNGAFQYAKLIKNLMPGLTAGFFDPANNNYQLAAGSPCIDAGAAFSPYTNGFLGLAPDIGAFEFGAIPWRAGEGNSIAPPPAPSELKAMGVPTGIGLSWPARPEATSYTILRAPAATGPYTAIATNVATTNYTDTTVVNGTPYAYAVAAINANGLSTRSREILITPIPPQVGNGLHGEYYNNTDGWASTPVVVTRIDPVIDFDWGNGSPDPLVRNQSFSAAWGGRFAAPVAGQYTITFDVDDGVELYIDNQHLIDQWAPLGSGSYSATLTLTSGMHSIYFKYVNYGCPAHIHLCWSYPGQAKQVIPGKYLYYP